MKEIYNLLTFELIVLLITLSLFIPKKSHFKNVFIKLRITEVIYIIVLSLIITILLSFAIERGFTKIILFIFICFVSPYVYLSNKNRINNERKFDETILYCSNVGMLLKQTHNVYSSLDKVKNDYSNELNNSIVSILDSLQIDKEHFTNAVKEFEENYRLSIVQDLDILMMYMFYENSNVNDKQFEMYLNEVSSLEKDLKANKQKRKLMRTQYIGISICSIFTYWYFYNSLKETIGINLRNSAFEFINILFIFGTLLSLFFVDRYFNLNITKE